MKRHAPALVGVLLIGACTAGPAPTTTTLPPATTTTGPAPTVPTTTTTTQAPVPIATDGVTVTDDTIYLGVLADVTGPFSGTVIDVLDAQVAFWSKLNGEGGGYRRTQG